MGRGVHTCKHRIGPHVFFNCTLLYLPQCRFEGHIPPSRHWAVGASREEYATQVTARIDHQ